METIGTANTTLWYAVAVIVGLIAVILHFEKSSRVDGRISGAEDTLAAARLREKDLEFRLAEAEQDIDYLRQQVELMHHRDAGVNTGSKHQRSHIELEITASSYPPLDGKDGGVNG